MAEPTQDGFFREIEEELREENLKKLWQTYGTSAIAAAVFLVMAVAGYQGWRHYDVTSRMDDGKRFAAANVLAKDGKTEDARQAFISLSQDGRAGYALLARFQEANLASRRGNLAEAAQAFGRISADTEVDPLYRDLATVLAIMHEMDNGDPAALETRLAPLMANTNPWRHSARELTAVLALSTGNTGKARETLVLLTEDPRTPGGIRGRAGELLAALDVPR